MNVLLQVEEGNFFERRWREGCAECAEEVKEKDDKIKKIENKNNFLMNYSVFKKSFFFCFPFVPSILRPLRNLRALCVQKLLVLAVMTTSHPSAGAAQ
jgi:hypothetical protein